MILGVSAQYELMLCPVPLGDSDKKVFSDMSPWDRSGNESLSQLAEILVPTSLSSALLSS